MRSWSGFVAMASVIFVTARAAAQQDITIQLPTFNMTTVRTTVTVPDGGTGLLGGISRASEGSVSRGVPMLGKVPGVNRLFKSRGIGRDVGLSQMTVSPRIISLEEEELRQTGVSAEMLSQIGAASSFPSSRAGTSGIDPAIARQADFIARNVARHPAVAEEAAAVRAPPAVHDIRRQNELARAQRAGEAEEYLAKGRHAEAAGKIGVAKIWYEMAARRADGELREKVAERLAGLTDSTSVSNQLAGRP